MAGTANFSAAATNSNDENMLVIRGNPRVADIFTNTHTAGGVSELFLKEKPEEWLSKYAPGKLKAKRLNVYTSMTGFTTP